MSAARSSSPLAAEYILEGETIAEAVMRFLEQELTEDRTDGWIDSVMVLPIPLFLRPFARFVLDWAFPERILTGIRLLFIRFGLLPRVPDEQNPFKISLKDERKD